MEQPFGGLKNFINQALIFSLFVALTAVVGVTAYVGYTLQNNVASEDASAIVDGKLEEGYPSAAYLLTQDNRGSLRECGSVIISDNRAITAAHCVDPDSSAFVGADRPDATKNLVTTAINIHPRWNGASNADSDLAIINLADDRDIPAAKIGSPRVGCNYIIVGYGQDQRGLNGLRKSADVCIEDVSNFSMKLGGLTGTACFGDSGSPIFKKGTNEVVGIVSQILTTADNPCARTDSIRATRIDSNLNQIFAPEINFVSSNVDQPISLELRLIDQEYIGDDLYNIEIVANILNNTRDPLSELNIDWCTSDAKVQNVFQDITATSDELAIRSDFNKDDNCNLLEGVNSLVPFSNKVITINSTVKWNSSQPLPIDMFVSAVIGDKYRVFALSSNRDLPQVLPNSSTLLVNLQKPLVNPDNRMTLTIAGLIGLGVLIVIGALDYIKKLLAKNDGIEKEQ